MDESLTIDHLLSFVHFDNDNVATLSDGNCTVKINKDEGCFKIIEDGVYLKSIKVYNVSNLGCSDISSRI